jgi:GNAT superfamily N-acetyltransferase
MEIVPFAPAHEDAVVALIVPIQREEFGIDITAEQQPDLRSIPSFYQTGAGGFWLACSEGRVVGTIALLDIGGGEAALRKMFVHRDHRGAGRGVAARLLGALLGHAAARGLRTIYLGTTPDFHAAHRFYEKNGFVEIAREDLPASFPVMEVDTRFYRRALLPGRTPTDARSA